MAYRIQYSPSDKNRYPGVKERVNFRIGYWAVVLMVFAAALWFRFYGVPDFLIPGDPEVTRKAASLMMDELENGNSFGEAATVFCKEILHGAGF